MEFFKNIKNSIYGPDYYQKLLKKPFSYSLKYYLLLILIISLLGTVILSVTVLPRLKSFLDKISPKILEYYPEELEIKIKEGKVSTNVEEPYFIKFPQELPKIEDAPHDIENILVIDTEASPDPDQLSDYKTLILLTKEYIVYYEDCKIVIQPLKDMPDLTINKSVISGLISKIEPFLKLLIPLAVLFIFIVFFIVLNLRLIYLLLAALAIWLLAKIKKLKIGYGKSYQLGLHLMTLGLFVQVINFLLLKQIHIPYLFTIILVILTVINLKIISLKETKI